MRRGSIFSLMHSIVLGTMYVVAVVVPTQTVVAGWAEEDVGLLQHGVDKGLGPIDVVAHGVTKGNIETEPWIQQASAFGFNKALEHSDTGTLLNRLQLRWVVIRKDNGHLNDILFQCLGSIGRPQL